MPEEIVREDRVERPAGDGLDAHKQIAQEEPAGGQGQGDGHVQHRALAGPDLGLSHDLQAVGNRFDAGVRAAAERIGPQEDQKNAHASEGGQIIGELDMDLVRQGLEVAEIAENAVAEHQNVRGDEGQEDRRQQLDGFLDSPDVQDHQEPDEPGGGGDLILLILQGQVTEQRVGARSDGDRNREHVVDDQRSNPK